MAAPARVQFAWLPCALVAPTSFLFSVFATPEVELVVLLDDAAPLYVRKPVAELQQFLSQHAPALGLPAPAPTTSGAAAAQTPEARLSELRTQCYRFAEACRTQPPGEAGDKAVRAAVEFVKRNPKPPPPTATASAASAAKAAPAAAVAAPPVAAPVVSTTMVPASAATAGARKANDDTDTPTTQSAVEAASEAEQAAQREQREKEMQQLMRERQKQLELALASALEAHVNEALEATPLPLRSTKLDALVARAADRIKWPDAATKTKIVSALLATLTNKNETLAKPANAKRLQQLWVRAAIEDRARDCGWVSVEFLDADVREMLQRDLREHGFGSDLTIDQAITEFLAKALPTAQRLLRHALLLQANDEFLSGLDVAMFALMRPDCYVPPPASADDPAASAAVVAAAGEHQPDELGAHGAEPPVATSAAAPDADHPAEVESAPGAEPGAAPTSSPFSAVSIVKHFADEAIVRHLSTLDATTAGLDASIEAAFATRMEATLKQSWLTHVESKTTLERVQAVLQATLGINDDELDADDADGDEDDGGGSGDSQGASNGAGGSESDAAAGGPPPPQNLKLRQGLSNQAKAPPNPTATATAAAAAAAAAAAPPANDRDRAAIAAALAALVEQAAGETQSQDEGHSASASDDGEESEANDDDNGDNDDGVGGDRSGQRPMRELAPDNLPDRPSTPEQPRNVPALDRTAMARQLKSLVGDLSDLPQFETTVRPAAPYDFSGPNSAAIPQAGVSLPPSATTTETWHGLGGPFPVSGTQAWRQRMERAYSVRLAPAERDPDKAFDRLLTLQSVQALGPSSPTPPPSAPLVKDVVALTQQMRPVLQDALVGCGSTTDGTATIATADALKVRALLLLDTSMSMAPAAKGGVALEACYVAAATLESLETPCSLAAVASAFVDLARMAGAAAAEALPQGALDRGLVKWLATSFASVAQAAAECATAVVVVTDAAGAEALKPLAELDRPPHAFAIVTVDAGRTAHVGTIVSTALGGALKRACSVRSATTADSLHSIAAWRPVANNDDAVAAFPPVQGAPASLGKAMSGTAIVSSAASVAAFFASVPAPTAVPAAPPALGTTEVISTLASSEPPALPASAHAQAALQWWTDMAGTRQIQETARALAMYLRELFDLDGQASQSQTIRARTGQRVHVQSFLRSQVDPSYDRVFQRRVRPLVSHPIAIVLDASASMQLVGGAERKKLGVALLEAIQMAGLADKLVLVGTSGGGAVVLKTLRQPFERDRVSVMTAHALQHIQSESPDVLETAVEAALAMLVAERTGVSSAATDVADSNQGMLLVCTDGYAGRRASLARTAEAAERQGILMAGIGFVGDNVRDAMPVSAQLRTVEDVTDALRSVWESFGTTTLRPVYQARRNATRPSAAAASTTSTATWPVSAARAPFLGGRAVQVCLLVVTDATEPDAEVQTVTRTLASNVNGILCSALELPTVPATPTLCTASAVRLPAGSTDGVVVALRTAHERGVTHVVLLWLSRQLPGTGAPLTAPVWKKLYGPLWLSAATAAARAAAAGGGAAGGAKPADALSDWINSAPAETAGAGSTSSSTSSSAGGGRKRWRTLLVVPRRGPAELLACMLLQLDDVLWVQTTVVPTLALTAQSLTDAARLVVQTNLL